MCIFFEGLSFWFDSKRTFLFLYLLKYIDVRFVSFTFMLYWILISLFDVLIRYCIFSLNHLNKYFYNSFCGSKQHWFLSSCNVQFDLKLTTNHRINFEQSRKCGWKLQGFKIKVPNSEIKLTKFNLSSNFSPKIWHKGC